MVRASAIKTYEAKHHVGTLHYLPPTLFHDDHNLTYLHMYTTALVIIELLNKSMTCIVPIMKKEKLVDFIKGQNVPKRFRYAFNRGLITQTKQ